MPSLRARLPALEHSPDTAYVMQKQDPLPPAAPSRRAVLLAGHGASQPAEQGPPEPCAPPVPARSPLHPTRGGSCGNHWGPAQLRRSRGWSLPFDLPLGVGQYGDRRVLGSAGDGAAQPGRACNLTLRGQVAAVVTHHLESSVQDSWRGRVKTDLEGRLGAPLCQQPINAGRSPENHSYGRAQAGDRRLDGR